MWSCSYVDSDPYYQWNKQLVLGKLKQRVYMCVCVCMYRCMYVCMRKLIQSIMNTLGIVGFSFQLASQVWQTEKKQHISLGKVLHFDLTMFSEETFLPTYWTHVRAGVGCVNRHIRCQLFQVPVHIKAACMAIIPSTSAYRVSQACATLFAG